MKFLNNIGYKDTKDKHGHNKTRERFDMCHAIKMETDPDTKHINALHTLLKQLTSFVFHLLLIFNLNKVVV